MAHIGPDMGHDSAYAVPTLDSVRRSAEDTGLLSRDKRPPKGLALLYAAERYAKEMTK